MKTSTPQKLADVQVSKPDGPSYAFNEFCWTESVTPNGTASTQTLCELVSHVKDVAGGAALVFELLSAHQEEIDSDNRAYLSPFHLALLRQMATRSLRELDQRADGILSSLQNQVGGQVFP